MRGRWRLLSLVICLSTDRFGVRVAASTKLKESEEDASSHEEATVANQEQPEEQHVATKQPRIPLLAGPREEASVEAYQHDNRISRQRGSGRKPLLTEPHHRHIQFLWNAFQQIPKLLLGGGEDAFRRLLVPGGTGHRHRRRIQDSDLLFRKRAVSRPAAATGMGVQVRADGSILPRPDEDRRMENSDPHVGMLLTVVNPQHEISYELMEILHVELGGRAVHVNDYAYTPVLSEGTTSSDPLLLGHQSSEADDDESEHEEGVGAKDPDREHEELPTEDTMRGDLDEASHPANAWWQWWIPRRTYKDRDRDGDDPFRSYRMNRGAFAGGSHGQVWRGRRRCDESRQNYEGAASSGEHEGIPCNRPLILKRLKVDTGYRMLEAGLREVHFGRWLAKQEETNSKLFTRYVDHFFREDATNGQALDLWIVFADAGPSLRSYLYTGIIVGDLVLYQQSALWTKMRLSVATASASLQEPSKALSGHSPLESQPRQRFQPANDTTRRKSSSLTFIGREVMRTVLRQILEAAAFLHNQGIVHRDIKPSNVMCASNISLESVHSEESSSHDSSELVAFPVHCVLGDFSSAWSLPVDRDLYTQGPSRFEQTDEYAPPEAIFGNVYNRSKLSPAFDSWSIGILALEMLLGSPNVFTVDQRTRAVLTHKLKKEGATEEEVHRALYLAALSQFCIYNPSLEKQQNWTLTVEESIHKLSMVKASCTLRDFHRALRARDPLGLGFDDSSDNLLQLIWHLLAWNPDDRILPAEALKHAYFVQSDANVLLHDDGRKALASQMLDPRMDFNLSTSSLRVTQLPPNRWYLTPTVLYQATLWINFHAPNVVVTLKTGILAIGTWPHQTSRRHAKLCEYDRSALPSCLSSHAMLPTHPHSGYCDIQGRRRTIEDFHAIRLAPAQQFYGIFDGHTGNLASKYVASFLYDKLDAKVSHLLNSSIVDEKRWKRTVEDAIIDVFGEIHNDFLAATSLVPHAFMDQSGTTATAAIVTSSSVTIASLGDSRAVMSSFVDGGKLVTTQLTTDHVASDPREKALVEARGGRVLETNRVSRVEGVLVITRSIGDARISPFLSREPHVTVLTKTEVQRMCGAPSTSMVPCFLILASDGLWYVLTEREKRKRIKRDSLRDATRDTISNQEAIEIVSEVVSQACGNRSSWNETTGMQQAAEALTLEAYVRGSRDNIGVVVVALE